MRTRKKSHRNSRRNSKLSTLASQNGELLSQNGRAVATLREMLLTGEFRPGERISELRIAARLGVSRTPVRIALERLALEGLLETSPRGGFTVKVFTIVEIWDAIEVRAVLEGTAARLAAERLTHPHELDELRNYCEQLEALPTRQGTSNEPKFELLLHYSDINAKFHAALVDLARSTMLKASLTRLHSIPFAAHSANMIPEGLATFLDVALKHHRAILDAVARKDGLHAEVVAREHARLARRHLEVALQHSLPGASLVKIDPQALSIQ
jgi:GntR family transcriptional regulator, vanillate catabolism transcriptional regulator